jgi:predicted nucleotidyltransferase
MAYGLTDRDLNLIIDAAMAFPQISQLILFGSRAKGTYKPGSDVDLAIKGEYASYDTAVRLAEVLNEEKPLPYFFDVLLYEGIKEPRLVEHIDRIGAVIYCRDIAQAGAANE